MNGSPMNGLIPDDEQEIEKAGRDRFRIAEMRDGIRQSFAHYFTEQGFQLQPAGSLIPETDKSVLFTGSTISTFKPYLERQDIPHPGLHMVQSCLRTQNVSLLNDDARQPQWASYFSSIGALANYDELDSLSALTWTFFTEVLGIVPERFAVRIASKDIDLLRAWPAMGLANVLERDVNPPVYYTHKFGMDGVAGRNCNLAIKDHRTGNLRDIGNIIVIESESAKLGTEIAFGVETIVSRLLGFSNPIAASLIADIVPANSEHSLKLADALSSSLAILNAGERPVVTNRGRLLRKYLQAVGDLRQGAGLSLDDIERYGIEFEAKEFGYASPLPAQIKRYVASYETLQGQGFKPEKVNERLSDIFPPSPSKPLLTQKTLPATVQPG